MIQAGKQKPAAARITDLEKAWDDAQSTLQPLDDTGWTYIDGQIDAALTAVRADAPDTADETTALSTLLDTLK